jgi:hypothetical protein
MIIFHRFGTVPREKNAFSHHFSKFSFQGVFLAPFCLFLCKMLKNENDLKMAQEWLP